MKIVALLAPGGGGSVAGHAHLPAGAPAVLFLLVALARRPNERTMR